MSIDPSSWGEWADIPITDIDPGTKINDASGGLLNDYFNNQEVLREVQISTQFEEVSTTSATYTQVETKNVRIPTWCKQPGSGKFSDLEFVMALQAYVSGGGSADIRVRINSGSWIEQTGIVSASYSAPLRFILPEADWASAYGTKVTIEIEARVTTGTVFCKDRNGCSMIRKLTV